MPRNKSTGMPVWGWILLGVCGFVFMGGAVACAGLLWLGKKTGDVIHDVSEQNAPSQQMGLAIDQYELQQPEEPTILTGNVRLDDYYNYDYQDAKRFFSFKMAGDRKQLSLWSERSSAVGKRLYELCKDAKAHLVTIRVQRIGPDGKPTARGRQGTQVLEIMKTD